MGEQEREQNEEEREETETEDLEVPEGQSEDVAGGLKIRRDTSFGESA